MPRLFYGNFDFEEQLHATPGQRRPAAMERLVQELTFGFLGVSTAEDRIWCPASLPATYLDQLEASGWPHDHFVSHPSQLPSGLTLEPWGWSNAAIRFGEQWGLQMKPPPLDLVRYANSREFSARCESADPLHPSRLCRSTDEVQAFLRSRQADSRWVIKANWSHAARERILGNGPDLDPAAEAWLRQRLSRDGMVCAEFWLERVTEFGVQWQIDGPAATSAPKLVAITELLVDPRGQYMGTRFLNLADPIAAAVIPAANATLPVVRELAQRGYRGPVGIDVMRYRVDGQEQVRPFQDINARWTMGRLAAGWFARHLAMATSDAPLPTAMAWLHGSESRVRELAPGARWIPTSPERLDNRPVGHRTWLMIE
ncbi:MAG: hypothetical protein DWH91_19120 [Planctomycetota bacterium]|nr:MAG: hypothetical protein DWH91_19120 [Planctomycetota bacterium]